MSDLIDSSQPPQADTPSVRAPATWERHRRRASSSRLPTEPIPLCIVSASQLLREGLVRLLGAHLTLRVVGSYADPADCPAPPPDPPEHVVLLDAGLGQPGIVGTIHDWRARAALAAIVVIELANNVESILACIEAGANEYTLQGESAAEVAGAILRARQGTAQCSPEIVGQLFARLAALAAAPAPERPETSPLTPRELEVLHYIAQDKSNQEIADALVIQLCTVKHHVHNILQKLELRHRWDAARLAQERGWLVPS